MISRLKKINVNTNYISLYNIYFQFPTEAPPNFEEMISQDIIDKVINRVMDNFSLTESAMQIAIENAIKEMIKKIPEKLIRIRYNLFQVYILN